jgi:flagellin-like hook-associated protein FlgL
MIGRWLDAMQDSFRSNASMTMFVLLCCGGLFWFSFETFASKDEVSTIHDQVIDLVINIDRRHLEQRIHNIESEIFALDRIAASGSARSDDYDRLSKLRSELGSVERELRRIDNRLSN